MARPKEVERATAEASYAVADREEVESLKAWTEFGVGAMKLSFVVALVVAVFLNLRSLRFKQKVDLNQALDQTPMSVVLGFGYLPFSFIVEPLKFVLQVAGKAQGVTADDVLGWAKLGLFFLDPVKFIANGIPPQEKKAEKTSKADYKKKKEEQEERRQGQGQGAAAGAGSDQWQRDGSDDRATEEGEEWRLPALDCLGFALCVGYLMLMYPEVLKGVGEIVKGVGENVPL